MARLTRAWNFTGNLAARHRTIARLVRENQTARGEVPVPSATPRDDEPDPLWPEPHRCETCGAPTDYRYCSDACTPNCRHGERPEDCHACEIEADLLFDARRESH